MLEFMLGSRDEGCAPVIGANKKVSPEIAKTQYLLHLVTGVSMSSNFDVGVINDGL